MAKKPKTRASLDEILADCSEVLFPAEMGNAAVTLNCHGVEGDTPLHVMVWRDNNHAVLALIEAGADVNAVGDMSETPLHVALRKQNLVVIEAMLKAGATLTRVSEFGQTPLDVAKEIGGETLKLLAAR